MLQYFDHVIQQDIQITFNRRILFCVLLVFIIAVGKSLLMKCNFSIRTMNRTTNKLFFLVPFECFDKILLFFLFIQNRIASLTVKRNRCLIDNEVIGKV